MGCCLSQIFISTDLVDNYIGACKLGSIMKTTIILIRNSLAKFNLIANFTAKNLALRQQLIVLNRSIKRPQIKTKDRLFWIILFLFWKNWQDSLIVLKPETVVGCHK